jgi:hypothetical protein
VYSVGTNDLVVQTEAADVSGADTGDRDPDAYIDLTYYVFGQATRQLTKDMAEVTAVHSERSSRQQEWRWGPKCHRGFQPCLQREG